MTSRPAVLLMTLNRLCGSDEPAKKIELLKELTERMGPIELAKILPQTAKQIEQLVNLKLSRYPHKSRMLSSSQFRLCFLLLQNKTKSSRRH